MMAKNLPHFMCFLSYCTQLVWTQFMSLYKTNPLSVQGQTPSLYKTNPPLCTRPNILSVQDQTPSLYKAKHPLCTRPNTLSVEGQTPSLYKANPPLCTRLATSLCFQRNLTHSISSNPNPNPNYYLDQSGTSCTCYN